MFNFVICDDKEIFANKIQRSIDKVCNEININVKNFVIYTDPYDVANYIKTKNNDNKDIDVYFLDINFGKEINGLDLARKIREHDAISYIIFITSHIELSIYAFKYNLKAFDYISKSSLQQTEILKCLRNMKEDYENIVSLRNHDGGNKETIIVKCGPKNIELNFNDIYCFESCGPKITIFSKNGQIEINNSLKNIIELINSPMFYRCHNSYLINLNYIESIDKSDLSVKMKNGKECLIARQKKHELQNLFNERKIVI